MADYYIDRMFDDIYGEEYDEIDFENSVRYYYSFDPTMLTDLCKKSRKPIILGIRQYYKKYKKLSIKQRYCLAIWAAENL